MFDTIFYQAIVSLQNSLIKNTSGKALQELTSEVEGIVDAFDTVRYNYEELLREDPNNATLFYDQLELLLHYKHLRKENIELGNILYDLNPNK